MILTSPNQLKELVTQSAQVCCHRHQAYLAQPTDVRVQNLTIADITHWPDLFLA